MAVHNLQVTLAGANTQVSTTRKPVRQLMIQNNSAHDIRVGDKTTSSTVGIVLKANSVGSTNAGTYSAYNTDLMEWYIAGTAADVIDVLYIQ